jgi:hypothetical protein
MSQFENEKIEIEETTIEQAPETIPQVTENPIERADTVVSWIDKFLKMIRKYSAKKVLEAMLFVVLLVFLGLFAFKPEAVFKSYDEYKEKTHIERMDKRNNNTPLIQEELNKLRVQYNASWVSVWELHNSTNNLDGMPFIFASLTYESMNPGLIPIAEQFDNVRLSLYPLSSYLRMHDMWYGDVEKLKDIDNTAYYRAKALGIGYIGFKLMEVEHSPNAVLSFAFVEGVELPNMNEFFQDWVMASYKINGLLTIDKK